MTLNDLIAKIDLVPGAKTTVVSALILIVSILDWFGLVDRISVGLGGTIINSYLIPALAVTLGLKVVRPEGSPLLTSGGLAVAAAAAAGLFLSGCLLSMGPDGKYMHAELDPGVCLAVTATQNLKLGFGFCTEDGASTDTLDEQMPDEPMP